MPVTPALLRRRLAAALALGAVASTATVTAQHKLGPQQTSFKAPTIAAASDEGERAIKRITYPQGWKAELWAAEPDVAHGVALDVADDGRVFVAESFRAWRGVPDIRGIMDWLDEDLACKSVDDRLMMMQRHLKPDQMAGYYTNTERVRLLRDPKGTGKATVSTVFAENFATPLDGVAAGVLARGRDVFFANIPNVWRLRDADGDGVADERRSISYGHGIRVGFLGHDLHGLTFGPDGRLYFSIGDRASMVQSEGRTVGTPDSGAVFRCEPDGSGLEMVYQGLRNPQDMVFDAWGNLFTGDNNSDGGDQARWTWLVEGGDSGWRIGFLSRLLHRNVISEPLSDAAHRTGWVAGASALVRREVFERIGPMDDGFFLYYEETDFMRRAAAAGFECWYVPASRVVHLVGRSTGVTTRGARPGRRPAYWFDSRRRYFRKHHGQLGALALDAVFLGGYTTWCLRNLVARKPTIDPPCFWRDFAAHQFLPAWLRPRAPGA